MDGKTHGSFNFDMYVPFEIIDHKAPDPARRSLGRWLAVRVVAWGLRSEICTAHMMESMAKAFPHRDRAWRQGVLDEAEARNVIRANRRRMAGGK